MTKIRHAKIEDIRLVSILEKQIEKENAASFGTLEERFYMFRDGFLVAENPMAISGYAESCRWDLDLKNLEHFGQIKDFPKHHKTCGRNLYVIFVGVREEYRRQGIGSELVKNLADYSIKNKVREMQVVAGENLMDFYENLGFKFDRELPQFFPYQAGMLMRKKISREG